MKKIFYFIASAIVALGAVACQNDINDDITSEKEGVSINVTIAEQTRVHLGNFEEDKGYKLSFDEGDVLVARAERQYGTNYFFEYVKGEGDVYTFTCTQEGVSELVGTTPHFLYLGGLHEQADDLTGYGYICNTAAENWTGIGMYATTDEQTGKLGEEGHTVTLHALPVLKFTANEPVIFTSNEYVFFNNGWQQTYTTTTTGENIIIPMITSSGNEATVTVTTDSGFCKSFTKEFKSDKIYNLGTIEKEEVVVPAEKIYLVPNTDWKSNNAWFAAYFFNIAGNASAKMTDDNADGIYECEIPAGYALGDGVIFCRMNPEYSEFAWNVTEGEGDSFKVVEEHVYNQTADLQLEENKYFYITGWASGIWGDENTDPTVSVEGQTSEWALVGAFSDWKDENFVTTATANIVVLKNVTMKAAQGFLVRKPSTDWADKYGAGNVNYIKANHFIATQKDGADMSLEADGTYDIYFDVSSKNIYIMTAGTDYATATQQTTSGEEPKNEEVEVVDGVVLYLVPNSNWTQSNARFAVYSWDGGDFWMDLTAVGDGSYKVELPKEHNGQTVKNIIFCRMNPSTTANNWNNKWNQTGDLTVPTDGTNCYTVKAGTWDKGGGTWSTK